MTSGEQLDALIAEYNRLFYEYTVPAATNAAVYDLDTLDNVRAAFSAIIAEINET